MGHATEAGYVALARVLAAAGVALAAALIAPSSAGVRMAWAVVVGAVALRYLVAGPRQRLTATGLAIAASPMLPTLRPALGHLVTVYQAACLTAPVFVALAALAACVDRTAPRAARMALRRSWLAAPVGMAAASAALIAAALAGSAASVMLFGIADWAGTPPVARPQSGLSVVGHIALDWGVKPLFWLVAIGVWPAALLGLAHGLLFWRHCARERSRTGRNTTRARHEQTLHS